MTKECSAYTGLAGSFCTITSSNIKQIKVGSRVVYTLGAGPTSINSDFILYPPRPGNNTAFGHVVLDFVTARGLVTARAGRGSSPGSTRVSLSRIWAGPTGPGVAAPLELPGEAGRIVGPGVIPEPVAECPHPGQDVRPLFRELSDDEKRGLDAHAGEVLGKRQRVWPRSVTISQNERAVGERSACDRFSGEHWREHRFRRHSLRARFLTLARGMLTKATEQKEFLVSSRDVEEAAR